MDAAGHRNALLISDELLASVPAEVWHRFAAQLDVLSLGEDNLRSFDSAGTYLFDPLRLPLQQWRAREEGSAASLAIACLRLQEAVTQKELVTLFGRELAEELSKLGLFVPTAESRFRFALRLGALEGKFILSDPDLFHPGSVVGSTVATSRIHTAVAVDGAAWPDDGTLLDLGCGEGPLALALASVAQKVYGCDISGRAICLARVNAALNGCVQSERFPDFQQGDLFTPFAGRRFSRIVCQPPFIPNIGDGATLAHGGPLGDGVALRVLRQLGQHLSPEGRAVLCVEWATNESHSWQQRVQSALDGRGLIGIHCKLSRTPAEDYCALLAPHLCPVGTHEYNAFLKRMLKHYRDHEIDAIECVLHFVESAGELAELQAVREIPSPSLDHITAGYADRALKALRLAGAHSEILLRATLCPPEGFSLAESASNPDGFADVLFAPESLLPGGLLPAEAVAVLEAVGTSCETIDVLRKLDGEAGQNLLLVRQMLAQGLLFTESKRN